MEFDTLSCNRICLFNCMQTLLNIGSKIPYDMACGKLGKYPRYINSSMCVICCWLKLQKICFAGLAEKYFKSLTLELLLSEYNNLRHVHPTFLA